MRELKVELIRDSAGKVHMGIDLAQLDDSAVLLMAALAWVQRQQLFRDLRQAAQTGLVIAQALPRNLG